MKVRILLLPFIFLGLSSPLIYAAENWTKEDWEQAFSRRNYQLGMTLTEFRAEKFPDQDVQLLQDPDNQEVNPLCSNNPKTQDIVSDLPYIYVPSELQKAGVVICRYYYSIGDSPYAKSIKEAKLLAADWGTTTGFYFVKSQGADDYYLYQIISTSEQPIFNKLLQAYTAAMRTAPSVETVTVQNRVGAKFENVIASWENVVSTLRLEMYYSDLDTLGIILTLTSLDKVVEERMKDVIQGRAKRL